MKKCVAEEYYKGRLRGRHWRELMRKVEVMAEDHRGSYPNGLDRPVLPVDIKISTCKISAIIVSCPSVWTIQPANSKRIWKHRAPMPHFNWSIQPHVALPLQNSSAFRLPTYPISQRSCRLYRDQAFLAFGVEQEPPTQAFKANQQRPNGWYSRISDACEFARHLLFAISP